MAWNQHRLLVAASAGGIVAVGVIALAVVGALVKPDSDSGGAQDHPIPEAIVLPEPLEAIDIPAPPIPEWATPNVVPLIDGSGLLVLGGYSIGVDEQQEELEAPEQPFDMNNPPIMMNPQNMTLTFGNESAAFEFDTGEYQKLPAPPVASTLGLKSAARVGDKIIVAGWDCDPPVTRGPQIRTCEPGDRGERLLLSLDVPSGEWTRVALPHEVLDVSKLMPTLIAVEDEGVWVAIESGGRDRFVVRFDPASGEFDPAIEVPISSDTVCVFNGRMEAFDGALADGSRSEATSRMVWDGTQWNPQPPFVDRDRVRYFCTPDGVFVIAGGDTLFSYDFGWTDGVGEYRPLGRIWSEYNNPAAIRRSASSTPLAMFTTVDPGPVPDLANPRPFTAMGVVALTPDGAQLVDLPQQLGWMVAWSAGSYAWTNPMMEWSESRLIGLPGAASE